MVVSGAWEEGERELVFEGDRASVWEDENYPKMDGGEGCGTMHVCLMPLNCTPNRDGKYHVTCIVTTITLQIRKKDKEA